MKPEPLPTRSHARQLIEFLHALTPESVPASAIEAAKWALLDTVGCALFGAPESWSRIMAEEMIAEGSKGRSTIVGRRELVAAPAAALCNATAAHGFELDDHLDEAIVHPGAIVISAALAAAEAVDASGARVLLGVIAGYEMLNHLGLALGVDPARRGYHKTAVAGPIGAAVTAGVIMNLGVDQLQNAVGLACATASGTKAFAAGEGGGMEKRMHAGRAAEAGVRMAQLASRGFTAPPGAVDGRFGVLEVIGGDTAHAELLSHSLGAHWAIENVYVKLYPCCAWIQAAVQQLVSMRGPQPLTLEQIRRVRVGVSSYAAQQNGNPLPQDTFGAQFSIQYCAALALMGNPSDPAMYAPEAIDDGARHELARRVELGIDAEAEAAYPKHYSARVALELMSGEHREGFVLDPHGMPADPCTETELLDKFSRLASRAKSADGIAQVVKAVRSAERLKSVRQITDLLKS